METMIRLDSIKIHAPADVLKDRNIDFFRFDRGGAEADGKVQKDKLIAYGGIVGLKSIQIDNVKQDLQIELSAKILGDDYFNLININTIEQVFDTINRTGIIEIDKADIPLFSLHSADCTKNIKGRYKPNEYMDNLNLMPQNTKYQKTAYRGTGENKHKTGIVFAGKQKTFKERMIVYDKREELKKEKQFLKSVSRPLVTLNQFMNVTRVECSFTSYQRIREFFGTDLNLINVLQSDKNPAFKVYSRIKGNANIQLELFNYPETMSWHQLVTFYGGRQICIDCNSDLSVIKDLIRKHTGEKTGISYQVQQMKRIMNMIGDIETGTKTDNEVIADFEYLLKTA